MFCPVTIFRPTVAWKGQQKPSNIPSPTLIKVSTFRSNPKKYEYQDIKFLLQRVFLPENVTYFETLSSAENVTSESDVENED